MIELVRLRPPLGRPRRSDCQLSGTIDADQTNETFDSADGGFDAVVAPSNAAFPVAVPDPEEVRTQLQAADSAARSAQMQAYLGVGLGVIGCLSALLLWLTRPRGNPGVL